MKTPKRLQPLIDDGLIDEVLSRLMSGKEADVFVVRCGEHIRCAKVYKDAVKRSFKKAAQYQEGRKVRGGRQARAMGKRSSYGRQLEEEIWQNAEVDALSRLARAGVRVPDTYFCVDGVLLMELVSDSEGDVAPQLGHVSMSKEEAIKQHTLMMHYIMLMLCAGIIHGDLSEFNVLVDDKGPVIIDLPQAVNASANNSAEAMFARDVNNMRRYYSEFAPELLNTQYAKEMWALFEEAKLTPNSILTGEFEDDSEEADVDSVLDEIQAAADEEQERLARINFSDEE
ncbi:MULTISPECIES: PA4780 family RIO1-like protein kinase [Pseudoalteromonas]|uniref:non-specific serine/threonine protein kinase n=1 Tax=Pseudoalteromonas marina TaxID=267375 RepID=A0ABT9FDR4_9GAMM|nr:MULTISPECIES: PA4780 family RIO1-like protein kinase [Pseudoalteromonas]MBL1383167.1 serine protein kinase RIO [Colwellia sp.]MCK8121291.1 serine protein kinase RIO [Pseudoalteromonas sp. 2CM32C]KAF7778227.1 RIO kinase 1 [Pseudoalteromonas marina]MDA8938892.1 serine protein kinase RIO [Pseudoalteromonas marina]MDP2486586.1 PA4780 family RIO1-like protein kinase [Pseudoalteromonas marina]